jgi:dTDP-4-dehydrorhamnose reductase
LTRYLLTGTTGMLGADLQVVLAGSSISTLGRCELDITVAEVRAAVSGHDVVINAAAYRNVDEAESYA